MTYDFINRQKFKNNLLMILSGYKPDIWDKVFERLYKYIPNDFDVCIVNSGTCSNKLMNIAKDKNWSYLTTEVNNLCYAQNVCIENHPCARYIFKIDEDMFLTEGTLEKMLETYDYLMTYSDYEPSAIVPMINVNCTTYIELLRRVNKRLTFEKLFGQTKITNGLHHNKHILENAHVAKFMWNAVDIDDKNVLSKDFDAIPCATRFSIGLIMFPRQTWIDMKGFSVLLDSEKDYERKGLGIDEKDICTFAMLKAKPIMIDRRCLVGHLAYGPQTKEMIEFFKSHKDLF